MPYTTRRRFLQKSAMLLGGGIAGYSFIKQKLPFLLSFSTLACPDWTFGQIVSFARQNGYQGIELRGLLREMDITKCKEFSTQNRKATLLLMQDNQLKFADLGSSCTLHYAEGEERRKNIDEGKCYIDLAQAIDCPYIRVFPNLFLTGQTKESSMELISKGLLELGEHAKGSNVKVLVESHGDLVYIDDLLQVMQSAAHPNTGIIWDIANMWTKTGEAPEMVYSRLKPYIFHTHVKDAKKISGEIQYKLLTQGDVPVLAAIDLLYTGNYKGYYSFEWEKLWHPEIAAPEIALADYSGKMNQHFNQTN